MPATTVSPLGFQLTPNMDRQVPWDMCRERGILTHTRERLTRVLFMSHVRLPRPASLSLHPSLYLF